MQKGQSKTSSDRRMHNTTITGSTKKNMLDSMSSKTCSTFNSRVTMSSSDFISPQNAFVKERIGLSEGSKKADKKDVELKFLYNNYLQTIMVEHIMKKKIEERKNEITVQLATIAKECAQDEERLLKLKIRNKDIIHLTSAQNNLDAQIEEYNRSKSESKNLVQILSHLCSLLEPLDLLHCNNIILPDSSDEWEEMQRHLKKCTNTLERIMEIVGTQLDTYKVMNNGIKEFVEVHKQIETLQKKFEDTLCSLQKLVLKNSAL